MTKEWIDALAEDLKQQGRDAAEAYGREQHRAGIVANQAPAFFTALAQCLQDDIAAIRTRLQGSAVASETTVERTSEKVIRLDRARFPWFEATLSLGDDHLTLVYSKDRATQPSLPLPALSAIFTFQVDSTDRLSAVESFASTPRSSTTPEDLSRRLVEILFKP